ncbi:MAG: hypothetical protein ACJ780_25595 [Solirubrobacteraceae bacterium]
MHGGRYGDVLLVAGHLNQIEATVYNTLGLNDCPDDLWRARDPEVIKKAYRARAVILKGPRYFLMDQIGIVDPGQELFDFGGLEMRGLATLPLSPTDLLGGLRRHSYTEQTIRRTTIYVYAQGREVYELVAPNGLSRGFGEAVLTAAGDNASVWTPAPEEVPRGPRGLADPPLVARRDPAPGRGEVDDPGVLGSGRRPVPVVWPAVGAGPSPLRSLARRSALGRCRGAPPRSCAEVLLR